MYLVYFNYSNAGPECQARASPEEASHTIESLISFHEPMIANATGSNSVSKLGIFSMMFLKEISSQSISRNRKIYMHLERALF